MATLTIELPNSLRRHLDELAEQEGISVERFVATAVAEKMSALMTETYLKEHAEKGDRTKFEAALAKVPDVEPPAQDRLPERRPATTAICRRGGKCGREKEQAQ
ncbi:MAG: toxin-antitoxin system HicB family antitoxin [Thermodesulfobacteriota bacterium]